MTHRHCFALGLPCLSLLFAASSLAQPPVHQPIPPKEIDCPSNPGSTPPSTQNFHLVACPAHVCDGQHLTFPVQAWLNGHGSAAADPDVCLRPAKMSPGNPDKVHWQSAGPNTSISIVDVREYDENNPTAPGSPAYIFDCGGTDCAGPFPSSGSNANVDSPALSKKINSMNGCYEFKATIKVTDDQGKSVCYDPHIYTGCTDCAKPHKRHKKSSAAKQ